MKNLLQNPLFVELLAIFLGDGWIEKRGTAFYLCGSPIQDKWHYDNFVAPIFSHFFTKVKPKSFPYWGVYGIVSYKSKIIEQAKTLGFLSGEKAHSAQFPKEVMLSTNPEIHKAAIRGIFDTDGTFHANKQNYANGRIAYHGRISISTCSKFLFEQLQELFLKSGFSCRTSFSPAAKRKTRNNSAYYRIMINKQNDVDRFFLEIGSNNLRHVYRFLTFKQLGYLPKGIVPPQSL